MNFEDFFKDFILKLLDDEQIQQRLVSLSGEVQNVAQANKTDELETLKKNFLEQEKVSENQKNELENELAQKLERIEQLENQLYQKQADIMQLEKQSKEKDSVISQKDRTIADLTDKLEREKQEQKDSEEKVQTLHRQLNELRFNNEELSAERDSFQKKMKELEKLLVFDEINKVYQKYCYLPEEILKSLDDLICRYSPVTFLLSGSANDNIPLLWGRIAKKVTEYSPEHIDILKEAFDLFFRYHSETYHTLERLHTEIGETYNVERHDRTPDSSPSGQIVQILLEGYQNTKTGKITKTIVRL